MNSKVLWFLTFFCGTFLALLQRLYLERNLVCSYDKKRQHQDLIQKTGLFKLLNKTFTQVLNVRCPKINFCISCNARGEGREFLFFEVYLTHYEVVKKWEEFWKLLGSIPEFLFPPLILTPQIYIVLQIIIRSLKMDSITYFSFLQRTSSCLALRAHFCFAQRRVV